MSSGKPGKTLNTRLGGHKKIAGMRQIVADPNGNREQRRAAKKLKIKEATR